MQDVKQSDAEPQPRGEWVIGRQCHCVEIDGWVRDASRRNKWTMGDQTVIFGSNMPHGMCRLENIDNGVSCYVAENWDGVLIKNMQFSNGAAAMIAIEKKLLEAFKIELCNRRHTVSDEEIDWVNARHETEYEGPTFEDVSLPDAATLNLLKMEFARAVARVRELTAPDAVKMLDFILVNSFTGADGWTVVCNESGYRIVQHDFSLWDGVLEENLARTVVVNAAPESAAPRKTAAVDHKE